MRIAKKVEAIEDTDVENAPALHGGLDQAKPAEIWDAGGEKVNTTQDLWPYVLVGVLRPPP